MQATTRHDMPPTSQEAADGVNEHSPEADKNAPSPEVEDSVMVAAKSLTRDGDHGNFTDKELRNKVLPYLRAIHDIDMEDDVSSIRRVRLWLSRKPNAEIVLVEGVRRDKSQVWKWQPYRKPEPPPIEKQTQQDLFT
jgi:hypothetical protein